MKPLRFMPGHNMLAGLSGSWQGPIAAHLVASDHLITNPDACVVQLVGTAADRGLALRMMQFYLHQANLPLTRFRVVEAHPFRSAALIGLAIDRECAIGEKPTLIFRDISASTLAFQPGDPWMYCAADLAEIWNCPVVSAIAWGSHPAQRPANLRAWEGARILEVKGGGTLGATITEVRPNTGNSWKAIGYSHPGFIAWDVEPVEKKEPAHV